MRIAAFAILFLLSACFEAETVLSVNANRQVEARATFSLARAVYDAPMFASAGGPALCGKGKLTVDSALATCTMTQSYSFDEVNDTTLLGNVSASVEEKSGEVVRLSLPLADLLDEAQQYRGEVEAKLQSAGFSPAAAGKVLGGLQFKIAIEAYQIVDSNGEVNAGRTRSEIAIPIAALLDGTAVVPDEFYAEVRVEKCRVAFLCR